MKTIKTSDFYRYAFYVVLALLVLSVASHLIAAQELPGGLSALRALPEAGRPEAPKVAAGGDWSGSTGPAPTPKLPSRTGETGASEWVATVGRKIVLEGYVRLRVPLGRVEGTARRVAAIATRYGGYVGSMKVYEDHAEVVLRVPSEHFSDALEDVRGLGEVVEVATSARDVTETYVDLQARLNALRAVESRLLALLEKAETVEDMLKVEDYLRRIRVDIERIEAQLKNLERSASYSTVRVVVEAPPKKIKPIVTFPQFDPLPAIASGLRSMYNVIYGLIVLFLSLLPLAPPALAAFLAYRYLKRRKEK